MNIELSAEDHLILNEIKSDIKQFGLKLLNFIYSIIKELFSIFKTYIKSLKDFSYSNVREEGLENILMRRAERFFKTDLVKQKSKKHQQIENKSIKIDSKRIHSKSELKDKQFKFTKNTLKKLILLPLYLIFKALILIKKYKSDNNVNKNNYS